MRKISILLFLVFCFVSCGSSQNQTKNPETVIREMVILKEHAIIDGNWKEYKSLLDKENKIFFIEQQHWFEHRLEQAIFDYSLTINEISKIDDYSYAVTLEQYYEFSESRDPRFVTFTEKYIYTKNGWKDTGLNYLSLETEHFIIKYNSDQKNIALQLKSIVDKIYKKVTDNIGIFTQEKTEIKLYSSKELLRETTDISVSWLFSGWFEYKEAIKLHAVYFDPNYFNYVLAHELVHKLTMERGNNLCYWFAEGLAKHYGDNFISNHEVFKRGQETPAYFLRYQQPISYLESINIELLTDRNEINFFYDMSSLIVRFMEETFGKAKIINIIDVLGREPHPGKGYDYASMDPANQIRFWKSVHNVTGLTKEAFNTAWLSWIMNQ